MSEQTANSEKKTEEQQNDNLKKQPEKKSEKMSSSELKTALLLAGIYTTRMLGLFIIFPVFSILAKDLTNSTTVKVGLALGIYSLIQAILQIPAGILSDIIGRKKVLFIGSAMFLAGSLLAMTTNDINIIILARALQGAGAVSGACLAFVADSTRPTQHGKVMAIIGFSIALSFVIAFALGAIIGNKHGLHGLFITTSILAMLAMVFVSLLPKPKQQLTVFKVADFKKVFLAKSLLLVNLQISFLHMVLSSSFFLIPLALNKSFGENINYGEIYLPAIIIAFILVLPMVRKRDGLANKISINWLILAIAMLLFSQALTFSKVWLFVIVLTIFFFAFTFIEASLPARLLQLSKDNSRGATSGIFSVYQFGGNFLGGVLGANIYSYFSKNDTINHSFYVLALITILVFIATTLSRTNLNKGVL